MTILERNKNNNCYNISVVNRLLLISLIIVICSGCSTVNMFKTMDVKENDLISARKYRSETENMISIGMTTQEVINLWGKPNHSYEIEQTKKNDYNYWSDEIWIYTNGKVSFYGKEISYRIYFNGNELKKIIEVVWNERFVGPQDL